MGQSSAKVSSVYVEFERLVKSYAVDFGMWQVQASFPKSKHKQTISSPSSSRRQCEQKPFNSGAPSAAQSDVFVRECLHSSYTYAAYASA